jgi:hypothetical protein
VAPHARVAPPRARRSRGSSRCLMIARTLVRRGLM